MAITGRVPLLLLLGVLPVLAWPAPVTVAGWVLLVVAACGVDIAIAVPPALLVVERELPASVRLTEAATSRLRLGNPSGRVARVRVRDAWAPSAGAGSDRPLLRVAPGESAGQSTLLRPSRRGDLAAAAVTVRSFGPLGLAARQASLAVPGRLRVLPEFRSRTHLPYRLARLRELDGQASVHVRGQGTEFDSLREYAAGDDVRSIDWRASARSVRTMVRTWRPERDRQVLLVLDTSRWAAGRIGGDGASPDQLRLDAGIEACLLLEEGDRVVVGRNDSKGCVGLESRFPAGGVDAVSRCHVAFTRKAGRVEVEDLNPYLSLDLIPPDVREAFVTDLTVTLDRLAGQRRS